MVASAEKVFLDHFFNCTFSKTPQGAKARGGGGRDRCRHQMQSVCHPNSEAQTFVIAIPQNRTWLSKATVKTEEQLYIHFYFIHFVF